MVNKLEELDTKSLVLDISVNLGRVGRFLLEQKYSRASQFVQETQSQLEILSQRNLSKKLEFPVTKSRELLRKLDTKSEKEIDLIDDCFTYSTILQHRSTIVV